MDTAAVIMLSPMRFMRVILLIVGITTNASHALESYYKAIADVVPTSTPSPVDGSRALPTGGWISPEYKWFFQFPLPIPSVKQPKLSVRHRLEHSLLPNTDGISTYTNNVTGAEIDYYEIEVRSLEKQIYPDLPRTHMVGYDGIEPGPKFMMRKGRGNALLLTSLTEAVVSSSITAHRKCRFTSMDNTTVRLSMVGHRIMHTQASSRTITTQMLRMLAPYGTMLVHILRNLLPSCLLYIGSYRVRHRR
jgi:hypothetical protein